MLVDELKYKIPVYIVELEKYLSKNMMKLEKTMVILTVVINEKKIVHNRNLTIQGRNSAECLN